MDLSNHRFDFKRLSDIERVSIGLAARAEDFVPNLIRSRSVVISDGHSHARRRQPMSHRAANSTAAAGY
jgi:hypothetical protein